MSDLTDRETRLYAVLFRLGFWCDRTPIYAEWYCRECGHAAVGTRAAVHHAIGCVFAELSAADVAALEAWEAVGA